MRLVTLVDGTDNQCLAVCGLDPKDDAPEEVPLWRARCVLVLIWEVGNQLIVLQNDSHQISHRQLRPLRNLELRNHLTLQVLLRAISQLLQVLQRAALLRWQVCVD